MRWILVGLMCSSLGCAIRTGSGALSASNIPLDAGYVPKTRMKQTACNWRVFALIPIGNETSAADLQERMARGSNGLTDIVVESEHYNAGILSRNCTTVTATPVTTGGGNG